MEEETKHIQMLKTSCEYRGQYLSHFINLEYILADFPIQIEHNGNVEEYYAKIKTAGVVIGDFWRAFDSVSHIIEFSNRDEAEKILDELCQARNELAHYILLQDAKTINEFDGNTIYLVSVHLKHPNQVSYTKEKIALLSEQAHHMLYQMVVFQKILHEARRGV
jgi:hypothetical protein